MNRLIAIGDIHGERWKLASLMHRLAPTPEDQLAFLGDYVDRGPDVAGTLSDLVTLATAFPKTIFLRGNHDQAMLFARDYFDPNRQSDRELAHVREWFAWGGADTIRSYLGDGPWYERVPSTHWEFLESTLNEYEVGPFRFVHAGFIPPGEEWIPPTGWSPDPRHSIREPFLSSRADFGACIIFGHTVQRYGPLIQPNKIGIDTGAVYGGPLTALILNPEDPNTFHFVEAK